MQWVKPVFLTHQQLLCTGLCALCEVSTPTSYTEETWDFGAACCIHIYSVMASLHYKSCMWGPVWGEHKREFFIQCKGFCTLDCTAFTVLITEVKIEKGIYNANETSSVQSAGQMHWLDACGFACSDKSIFFAPLDWPYVQHCLCCTNRARTLRSSSKLNATQV